MHKIKQTRQTLLKLTVQKKSALLHPKHCFKQIC